MFFRYMNISDEWETPEKQPFKDFVSLYLYLSFYLYYSMKARLTPYVLLYREICAIGLRTQTVVTSTV